MNFLKSLIGGQIVKGYSISGQPITGVGHHKQWKLYKGKKDSTGSQVSIFVIQKKSLKSSLKEQIIKSAKKQASTLAKIRHPGVLALIQPITQDQHFVSFVTQRVQGSLSTLIKQKKFQQYISSQLQLKLTLFPLLEAINFLHQIVKLCHLGINLESIYVTHDGKWKIAGMNYSHVLTGEEYQVLDSVEFYDNLHLPGQVVRESRFNKLSDSYSLGILFINFMILLKKSQHTLMQPTQTRQAYEKNSKSYKDYPQFPAIIQSTAPQQLIQLLSQLLTDNPTYRLNVASLQSSKWVNDSIVLTVKFLQKIANYENKQQVQFLKGLAGVIDKFSGKILHKRIIPILTNLLKFSHLVASVIFILLDIMKRNMITVDEWRKTVWSQLKPITQGKEMTAQSLYLLISNMEVLEKYVNEENLMACIIPLYLKCFDCPPKLKLLALKHVQRLTKRYDYQFTKTKIVPKLVNIMKDEKIQIRKDSLKALYSIINRLDPHTIVNVVLSGLQNCRKAGADHFINSITVQIYNKITTNMSAEILATKIMPGLMPYLIDPSIQKEEFGMYKNALMKMMNKIQDERKKTWSQQQNAMVSHEKFTEKDFVLEKMEVDNSNSGGKSNVNVTMGNDAKFDFLNEYKALGSINNASNNFQLQQKQNQSLPVNNNLNPQNQFVTSVSSTISQSNDFSFGFEVPKQSINQQLPTINQPKSIQSHNEEITITDYSFGNFDLASNFDMGFGNNNSNPKINTNMVKKQSGSEWNMSNLGGNNQTNQSQFSYQNTNQSQKPSEYKAPSFDFDMGSNQNGFSFQSQPQTKIESKEQPFSPSSEMQGISQSKSIIKGPSQSGTKKLVGPGHGAIKKPPKYNEFSMPPQQSQSLPNQKQTSSFTSSFDSSFPSSNLTVSNSEFSNIASFSQPQTSFTSKPASMNFALGGNDDPFAEVEQQYGISPITAKTNENINTNLNSGTNFSFDTPVINNNSNKTKSNDPFDDLL